MQSKDAENGSVRSDAIGYPSATSGSSFDHHIGAADQRGRQGDAQGTGGLQIDEQFHFRDQLDWKICGLLTIEDPSGIDAGATMRLRKIASIAHQPARNREVA